MNLNRNISFAIPIRFQLGERVNEILRKYQNIFFSLLHQNSDY